MLERQNGKRAIRQNGEVARRQVENLPILGAGCEAEPISGRTILRLFVFPFCRLSILPVSCSGGGKVKKLNSYLLMKQEEKDKSFYLDIEAIFFTT